MGTLPHFSGHFLHRFSLGLILVSLATLPVIHITARAVQSSDPSSSVTIANCSFQPQHINITTGTSLTWTNNDAAQHTVTSSPQTNVTQAGGPLISSGSLNQGQSFSYVFYKHGYYPYQCSFHPYMTGWVNVTGPDVQAPSQPTTVSFDYTPYIIAGVIGVFVILVVALFLTRRTHKSGGTSPSKQS